MILLKRISQQRLPSLKAAWTLRYILFACYLVGTISTLFALPLPFLLALWIFPKFVMVPLSTWRHIPRIIPSVVVRRKSLLTQVLGRTDTERFQEALEQLDAALVAGELSPSEYKARKKSFEEYIAWDEHESQANGEIMARSMVAAIGPFVNRWQNALWSAKCSIVLTLPLIAFYFVGVLHRET